MSSEAYCQRNHNQYFVSNGIFSAILDAALIIKLTAELKSLNILANAVGPVWVQTDLKDSAASRNVKKEQKELIGGCIAGYRTNGRFSFGWKANFLITEN